MPRRIPTFELYGELLSGNHVDFIHHEMIKERSSKHNWTIRLHRHSRLTQIFLFHSSDIVVQLDGIAYTSTEPLILVVPAGAPHGFQFPQDVVGHVLSLRIDKNGPTPQEQLAPFSTSGTAILPRSSMLHFQHIEELINQLRSIYHTVGPQRAALLDALTHLILTYLATEARNQKAIGSISPTIELTRDETKAERFCNLIENNFQHAWPVSWYASQTGISAPHLTRICKRILGGSPNNLVRQRRLLEAKRLLEYTRLPISEVAHKSGFKDAAFFSRTFKQQIGQTPQNYRMEKDA